LIWVADDATDDTGGDVAEGEGEERAIIAQYGRMVEGIRKLPRQLRAIARREARKWLTAELKGLRDRRTISRYAARSEKPKKIRWRGVWRHRPPDVRPP
jgi:hypothetical protein